MPDESQSATAASAEGQGLIIRPLPGDRGLALDGEADTNSRQALREALRGLTGAGHPHVDLELAGLQFIDVSCMREIIWAIEHLRPVQVRLRHPSRTFRRVAGCLAPGKRRPRAG
ncbi:MAG TPA: STAS domain-containing protein [Streptosporangiaceae bacterium]|nr:STAS domain-containing protein [Streptosporangiaceae bacterium]